MKKAILIFATMGLTLPGIAQDKFVVSALTALKENNLEEAKADIDKAMTSPETKEKPKALLAKAQIYYAMQNDAKYKDSHPYREAAQALMKLAEVKPDYEKPTVDQLLLISGFYYYNDGVRLYNDKNNSKKFEETPELMKNVIKIHDLNGGKRFEKSPKAKDMDTVVANANMIMANSYYYGGKYEEAIPLLIKVKNNPITQSTSAYECLVDAYNKQKNTAEAFATIQEGRKAFPNDVTLRNYELNYYISTGKMDELLKKLEEAGAKEPENADIQFNIATTYLGMANPRDGKKPANAAELVTKSDEAFQRALKISPDNAGYNYNYAALFFNQATDVNEQMNALGTSKEDQKKYDELKAKRDGLFARSLPYFEKSYNALSPNESTLKGEDAKTYKQTLLALKEVYARQSKMDKSAEMKKKYEAIK
jgi:predicted Zn-dependent protease